MVFHEKILTFGDGADSQGLIHDDVLIVPDEEVGFTANPLLGCGCLYALAHVVVVRPVPTTCIVCDDRNDEVGACLIFGYCAREGSAALRCYHGTVQHHVLVIDGLIGELNTDRCIQVDVVRTA